MANNGFDGYQSGGRPNKGYTSPNKAIETSIFREAKKEMGGDLDALDTMSVQDALKVFENVIRESASNSQATNAQVEAIIANMTAYSEQFDNARQFMQAGTTALGKEYARNLEMMKGLQVQRGTDKKSQGLMGVVNNNPIMQMVHTNQEILNRLNEMNGILADTNGDMNRNQNEEEGLFDTLRQTIVHTMFNNPTTNKLSKLGAGLISAGLYRVASNEKMPSIVRQAAMGAVYLQIPQTLMGIIGTTVQTVLSKVVGDWLAGTGSKMLGGLLSNFTSGISGLAGRLLPMAVPLIGGLLIAGGLIALVKGSIDHHKKMKANDAKIENDPTLTRGQKDIKKIKVHSGSGAKVGMLSGVLAGAGAGAIYGASAGSIVPGAGTAVGAVVGGLIGAIGGLITGGLGGAIIGALKPLGQAIGHLGQAMWNGTKQLGKSIWGGITHVAGKVVEGAKWAKEHKAQILKAMSPIANVLKTLFEMSSPFFMLFKMFANKILHSKWIQGWLGNNGSDGNGGPSTVNNPGTSGGVGRNIERLLNKGSTSYTKDKEGKAYLGGHLITSGYGYRVHPNTGSKYDGKQHFHKGIDLAYKQGESIGAFVGGTVKYAGNRNDGYGNTVEILDANGVTHKYHHGSSIPQAIIDAYKNGGKVKEGDVIMKAGATGYATGTHLDYETWQNGKHTDPLQYLAKVAEEKAAEEKRKKEEEAKAKQEKKEKEHPYATKAENAVKGAVKGAVQGFKDITGMNNYTNEQNCTNTQINRGAN